MSLILNGFHYCPNCFPEKGKTKDPCIPQELIENPTEENIRKILAMLSIDVIDPYRVRAKGKLTRSNIRILCIDANRKKEAIDPTDYDLKVIGYNKEPAEQLLFQLN